LHYAVERGHNDVVEALLTRGISTMTDVDGNGRTAQPSSGAARNVATANAR